MTERTIREMRDAAPFKAFEIHLSNGQALKVATADHFFFIPKSPEFMVVLPDGGFRIVDLNQVVSVGRAASRGFNAKAAKAAKVWTGFGLARRVQR